MVSNTTEDPSQQRRGVEFVDSDNELYLHHSDHPTYVLSTSLLNGRKYTHWKRSVEVSLFAKNKIGFVTGFCSKPTSIASMVAQWERCNNMIISWLLHSVKKDIVESVLYCQTTTQIWHQLGTQFSCFTRLRVYQLQRELSSILQGNLSISAYFTELKKF